MRKLILTVFFFVFCLPASAGELLLRVTPNNPETDGDIIVAVNERRIKDVYAQHICHPKVTPLNEHSLRASDTCLKIELEKTRQYKYERISQTEIRRINLWTMEMDILGPTPNKDGEYIDVPLFIERRLRHPRHKIFGEPGAEYWYSEGKQDRSMSRINEVWDNIEETTPHRRQDFNKWPFTEREKKAFFILKVDDFDDETAAELESDYVEIIDEELGLEIREKKYKVDYTKLPGVDVQRVRNKALSFDSRELGAFNRSDIVVEKRGER